MIGKPLAGSINLLARALGFLLKIDHSLQKEFDTLVISKYAGLGSIIQSTPLIQTLRQRYPHAKIIFVTTVANEMLLQHIHEIDEVIIISDKSLFSTLRSSMAMIWRMWKLKPGLFIDLEFYSNYSGIMTTLSKATNRLGFYNEEKTYRKGIHNYLVPFNVNSPISETYLQFAKLLGISSLVKDLKISSDPAIDIEQLFLKLELPLSQKYVIINPNASDLRIERRWPKTSFVDCIQYLIHEFPSHTMVLIGNKAEKVYVDEIESLCGSHSNLVNTAGKLNLKELVALIKNAELLLTNDTGPMHMAFALNTPTISLFGPCSPQQYGAIKNGTTFYKNVHCSPCVHKYILPPCKGNNICMQNISVTEVKAALVKSLS